MGSRDLQDAVGSTLCDVEHGGERRRMYVRMRRGTTEVGEVSCGPLTRMVFDAEEQRHCVHLSRESRAKLAARLGGASAGLEQALARHVSSEGLFLADLMDELDGWGIPYGYLCSVTGKCVSYRPARMWSSQ